MNDVLCGLAANPALPSSFVDRLFAVADDALVDDLAPELADRADLTHAQALALAARVPHSAVRLAYNGRLTAPDIDPVTQRDAALALLDRGAGDPRWARLFAADASADCRERLAECPGLPADVVAVLAADPEVQVVAELARVAGPDLVVGLASHPHAEVRLAVAANESTPAAVLAALLTGEGLPPARWCLVCVREEVPFAHDRNCPRTDCDLRPDAACDGSHESTVHGLRQAALLNPATPGATAAAFADHPCSLLRRALASRTDLPTAAYARLATDPVPGVRADLARNPAIDEPLIRLLADDRDHDVRRQLAQHPRVPLDVLVRLAAVTRLGDAPLPRITAASPAEMARLARSADPVARMLAARRNDLPAALRDALAGDADARVAKTVAPQPGLTEALLRSMVDRHGSQVLAGAAANPDAPPALLAEWARQEPPVRALRELAGHPRATAPVLLACLTDKRARRTAAARPELPPSALVTLLSDPDPQTARTAAANPSLPREVMAELLAELLP
ncbi:hypothetical protein ACFYVL_03410 [Streptomyces sp. NPDC004111]|uniref:hypothetical protein n=1 Tax=Streptomyces sp. NPDC004111 TaxID=3364690 RepID=UPI0036AB8702